MNEHYFTTAPACRAQERTRTLSIRGRDHRVTTASGVFSCDRVDRGTQVLLDHVPDPPEAGTLLDLGCGWGPLALAMAAASPSATVLATDVNERCLDLTSRNAAANGLTNVRCAAAGELLARLRAQGRPLDLIWSNPPVRIGKRALHELLGAWLPLLADGGQAWLVVGKNLGADSLARWLTDQGLEVTRAASSKGFRLLRARYGPPRG